MSGIQPTFSSYLDDNPGFGSFIDTCEYPLNALYRVNPEVAALVHADIKEGINSDLIPLLGNFRKFQRDEKLATVKAMVDVYSIDSNERMHNNSLSTHERVNDRNCQRDENIAYSKERSNDRAMRAKEVIARLGFDLEKYKTDSSERMYSLGIKTRDGMHKRETESYEKIRILDFKTRDGMHKRETESHENRHNATLENNLDIEIIRQRNLEMGIGLERDRISSDERKLNSKLVADVYMHQLSADAFVESEREKTTRVQVSENGLIERSMIEVDGRVRQSEIMRGVAERKFRRDEYLADSHKDLAIKIEEIRARNIELGISLQREAVAADERKHFHSVESLERISLKEIDLRREQLNFEHRRDRNRQSDQVDYNNRLLDLLDRAVTNERLDNLIDLAARIEENERKSEIEQNRLESEESVEIYRCLTECLKESGGNGKKFTFSKGGKTYTLEIE